MTTDSKVNSVKAEMTVVRSLWTNCYRLLNSGTFSDHTLGLITNYTYKIFRRIVNERAPDENSDACFEPGPLLQYAVDQGMLNKLLFWSESQPTRISTQKTRNQDAQRILLCGVFDLLLCRSHQRVLYHPAVFCSLLQFLFKLSCNLRPAFEEIYSVLLHELCVLLNRDRALYRMCCDISSKLFHKPYLICTLPIPLLYRDNAVGDNARDAILFILSLSKQDNQLGDFLADESDFCPVFATGLSGLYSSLPKKVVARYSVERDEHVSNSPGGPVLLTVLTFTDEQNPHSCIVDLPVGGANWHQLSDVEWNRSPDLRRFLYTLDYCNLIVKIAHPKVSQQLLHYIRKGFLLPVLGASLHQTSIAEVAAATAYLELFLRRLTEPPLVRLFLKFIITDRYEFYPILTSLINRLTANALVFTDALYQLGMVTLSLFRTILSFHCEDVMYELVFKYLIPHHHMDPTLSPDLSLIRSGGTASLSWLSGVPNPIYPFTDDLVTTLIRSGDQFLELAKHSGSDKLIKETNDEQPSSESNLLSTTPEDHTIPVESTNSDQLISNPSFFRAVAPSEHPDNDWIMVQAVDSTFTPRKTSNFSNYLNSAALRISKRFEACHTWKGAYLHENNRLKTPYTLVNKLSDLQLSNNETFAQSQTNSNSIYPETVIEQDTVSPVSATLLNYKIEPMYQISFESDSSGDETALKDVNFSLTQAETEPHSNHPLSSKNDTFSFNSNAISCTCLNADVYTSVVQPICSQCVDQDTELCSTSVLQQFITNLDSIPSLWQCPTHFGQWTTYCPWPSVDATFVDDLDMRLWILTRDSSNIVSCEINELVKKSNIQASDKKSGENEAVGSDQTSVTDHVPAPIAGGIGPFLSILLGRLTNMHVNSFFTNLLLTDLLSSLAAYPCPLLYHYLLNSVGLAVKTNVNTMFKTMRTACSHIRVGSASVDNWDNLIRRAELYLYTPRPCFTDTIIDPDFYSTKMDTDNPHPNTPRMRSSISVDRKRVHDINEAEFVWLSTPSEQSTPQTRRASRLSSETSHSGVSTCNQNVSVNMSQPLFPTDLQDVNKTTRRSSLASYTSTNTYTQHSNPAKIKYFWRRASRTQFDRTSQGLINSSITVNDRAIGSNDPVSDASENVTKQVRNLVFASIIFDEFCYELAALCYVHSRNV